MFTREEAARYCGLSPRTLANMAYRGEGPRYSRTGSRKGRALYRQDDLDKWLRDQRVR